VKRRRLSSQRWRKRFAVEVRVGFHPFPLFKSNVAFVL
jgi:hypothetical protein